MATYPLPSWGFQNEENLVQSMVTVILRYKFAIVQAILPAGTCVFISRFTGYLSLSEWCMCFYRQLYMQSCIPYQNGACVFTGSFVGNLACCTKMVHVISQARRRHRVRHVEKPLHTT